MNNSKSHEQLRKLILLALFVAIMIVLQLTGIGLINLGFINITFYCTLIAIGTMVLGTGSGLVMAIVFAGISVYRSIVAPSGLVAPLVGSGTVGVVFIIIMSFLPRILVPVVITALEKSIGKKRPYLGMVCGAVAGSLCNTVLYLGLMLVGYATLIKSYEGISYAHFSAVLTVIGSVVLCGGLPEAVAAGVIVPPIVTALRRINK